MGMYQVAKSDLSTSCPQKQNEDVQEFHKRQVDRALLGRVLREREPGRFWRPYRALSAVERGGPRARGAVGEARVRALAADAGAGAWRRDASDRRPHGSAEGGSRGPHDTRDGQAAR